MPRNIQIISSLWKSSIIKKDSHKNFELKQWPEWTVLKNVIKSVWWNVFLINQNWLLPKEFLYCFETWTLDWPPLSAETWLEIYLNLYFNYKVIPGKTFCFMITSLPSTSKRSEFWEISDVSLLCFIPTRRSDRF